MVQPHNALIENTILCRMSRAHPVPTAPSGETRQADKKKAAL
jgi:hypothetical protein